MFKKLLPLLLLVCPCCSKPQNEEPKKPIKVEAAEVMQATIPIFIEAIGHVRASLFAEIKSQVEGRLIAVHYDQAADVQEGALLATIDPSFYQAKLDEAEGVFLETKASLRFAEEKVARYAQLAIDDYVSKLNFDEYVTQREALIASLKKNEGLVKEAKVYLDYCFIKAPFSGRVGKRLVDEGNLIDNSGSTLVTLHQMEPIYVDFSVSEKHLPKLLEKNEGLTVKVQHSGGAVMEEIGRVIALDSSVDPRTGMISLRAEFANRGKKLWPGEFVKVRLILEEKRAPVLFQKVL